MIYVSLFLLRLPHNILVNKELTSRQWSGHTFAYFPVLNVVLTQQWPDIASVLECNQHALSKNGLVIVYIILIKAGEGTKYRRKLAQPK